MSHDSPKFGPEHHPAGTVIIAQGDIPDKFYIITRGEAEVTQRSGAEEVVINRLNAGDFFGEIGLLKRSKRVASVRAVTDIDLVSMDREAFGNWLSTSLGSRDEINEAMHWRLTRGDGLANVEELPPERSEAESDSDQASIVDERPSPSRPSPPATKPPIASAAHVESGSEHFEPGAIIVRQDDPADRFYIIVNGEVEVVHERSGDEEVVLARLGSGGYFGEIGLLEGQARMATVRATTTVDVVVFDRRAFSQWLSQAPYIEDEMKHTVQERLALAQASEGKESEA